MEHQPQSQRPVPMAHGEPLRACGAAAPTELLDNFLAEILPSMPVTLLPGFTDPANVSIPQQPLHPALFPHSRTYSAPPDANAEASGEHPFDSVTNPWEGYVDGWRLWGCSGQNVDDVLRYLDFADGANGEGDGETSVQIMEAMLRWRCAVPTAPDTLCEYA